MRVGGQRKSTAALRPGERPGTHCIGGWVGPRAGLDRCGKSRVPPGPSNPWRVAKPIALKRLLHFLGCVYSVIFTV